MKKIFYILASAIVALGAVACDNQDLDNIAPGVGGDSLSFSAVIDNTKTDLSGNATVWVEGDVVVFAGYEEYEFVYDGTANFTCTKDGVTAALGDKDGLTAWYNKAGIDSNKGTAGAQLKAEGCSFTALNPSFKFEVQNAFLKVTTKGQFKDDFVLTGTGLFSESDAFSIDGEVTDKYIAINPTDAKTTLTYSIGGVAQKVANIKFEAGTIYNLGELTAKECPWGLVGQHQGWDIANVTRLYQTTTANVYARGDIKLADNGFKFALVSGADWNNNKTNFGAWKKTDGKDFFDYSTEMTAGAWYQNVYTDNAGSQYANIGVSDFNKTYDIYMNIFTSGSWGYGVHYTVVEHGTAVTF